MTVYTSPDGGHTIREHTSARSSRRLGYLQQAIVIADTDPRVMTVLEDKMYEVLVYAVLCGHEVQDWSDQP